MDVFVIGQAVHEPAARIGGKRLEEIVFDVAHAALTDARVSRAQIDHVTIAGCDELDGRSISWDPLESTCRHASLSIL